MKTKFVILSICALLSATGVLESARLAEGKAAYFYPTSSKFRKIFSNGGAIYGLELSQDIGWNFSFWASGRYFSKAGFSIGEKDKTRVTFVPLAGGLKYLLSCGDCIDFYLGAGVVGTYLQTVTGAQFVFDRVSKWGVGGTANLGMYWYFSESFFVDFFADYTYTTMAFKKKASSPIIRKNADISGISVGGGIGFYF